MSGTQHTASAQRDGLLLAVSAALGMLLMNSPWRAGFDALLHHELGIGIAPLLLSKSVLHWVNDALMALFFLTVGIEIRHEWLHGSLATPAARALPFGAALGGMLVPALIYCTMNFHSPIALAGWAIPSATDIAFALGLIALFAPRTRPALLAFLVAVAVIDDLGAIIIIALFYTTELQTYALLIAALLIAALIVLSKLRVAHAWPYLAMGLLLWLTVYKSGVHATLAGVILGLLLPDKAGHRVDAALKPWVSWVVLPLFGIANAGVTLVGVSIGELLQGAQVWVISGVALGLCLGKPLGILIGIYLTSRLTAGLPQGMRLKDYATVACFCGIGFTMALFISSLAFLQAPALLDAAKIGVLLGTLLSLILGIVIYHLPAIYAGK